MEAVQCSQFVETPRGLVPCTNIATQIVWVDAGRGVRARYCCAACAEWLYETLKRKTDVYVTSIQDIATGEYVR